MNELFELSLELISEHILQILNERPLTKEEIMSRMWINNLEQLRVCRENNIPTNIFKILYKLSLIHI